MKSFKQMVSEVAKPISPDEQRFIDQHTYEVQKHPVALDHQFTGEIAGKPSKTTEPDASTYDAAYAAKEPAVERIGEEVEQMNEISRSMTPMKNKFGGRVDPKKFDAYKKYMKKNSLDEPTVRMIADDPDAGESKQMMNNPKYKEAMKLYRAAHIKEEVEQIDEISKDMAQRYYSKSQDSMHKSMSTVIGTKNARKPEKKKAYDDARKTLHKRVKGSDMAAKRLAYKGKNEEVELTENPMEEKPMMMGALRAMSHNMMGIAKYVQSTNDPEEWFQNKLAGVAKEMQTLYSYATAETMTGMATEETLDESQKASLAKKLAKASASSEKGKKAVTLKKAPWEKKEETELTDEELSAKQKKLDHNKNGKIDGHDLAMLRNRKKVRKEEVEVTEELLDEAMKFKAGAMKLKDGSQVILKKEDANALTAMFKDLSRQNQKKLGEVAKKDKSGFEEILGFAREAL